ncbi:MAG: amino acid ABC transporter substrate-binding protein [Culicoidibacterales bacterium]
MKKLLYLFSVILLAGGLLASCAKTAKTSEGTSYIIGLDDTFAPMGFKDAQGEYTGFDIELAKAVGENLGITFAFKSINWDSATLELTSKKIDLIWNGMSITPKRQAEMAISKPYFVGNQTIYTTDKSPILTKADLANKLIGIQLGSSAQTAFDADPISKSVKTITKYQDNTQAMLDLKAGRVDAVILDSMVGDYYTSQQPGYKKVNESFAKEDMGIGARKDDDALIAKIDSAIEQLRTDGTYDKIYQKWFGGTL